MSNKPFHDAAFLHQLSRRSAFRKASLLLGAGMTGAALRSDLAELLLGRGTGEALAQSASRPTYFIEICLREQWDLMHVLVPPGLAKDGGLARSGSGNDDRAACYWSELHENAPRRLFLTEDSACLWSHLDNIAMLEVNEGTFGTGGPHNHAAINPMRSPGYGGGRNLGGSIGDLDRKGGLYGTVPTPAAFHNILQKRLTPGLDNGVCLKLMTHYASFPGIVQHYGGGVPGGELSRYYNLSDLAKDVNAFNSRRPSAVQVTSGDDQAVALERRETSLLADALKRLDKRALERAGFAPEGIARHADVFDQLRVRNQPVVAQAAVRTGEAARISLAVTDTERARWGSIANRMGVRTPLSPYRHFQGTPQAQPWEQFLIGYKLLVGGFTRSFACELDWVDVHKQREPKDVSGQARVVASGLANLIEAFKASGLFQDTLIAVYTSDGSRSPRANVDGGEPLGRNAVLLAGGAIEGGYYGDVEQVRSGGTPHYRYFMPDASTGRPAGSSITDVGQGDRTGRTPGRDIWRTVAKAMGAADADAGAYAGVAQGRPLPFVLKS